MVHRITVFLGDSGFPDILAKSYKIVLSHTDTEDLYQQQAEVELEKGHLIQDIATRWNLLLVMIFCILKNKEAVRPHWPISTRLGLLTTSWRNKVQRLETILQQYRQKQWCSYKCHYHNAIHNAVIWICILKYYQNHNKPKCNVQDPETSTACIRIKLLHKSSASSIIKTANILFSMGVSQM